MAEGEKRKLKLVLGCGNRTDPGAINHDRIKHSPEVDVVWNLDDLPWPWDDNQFVAVQAWAVLEHLKLDLMESMNELHRIVKPGGVVDVKLPYWRSEIGYDDPTHHYVVGLHVFDQFDPETQRGKAYDFYTPRKWHVERCGLNRGGTSVIARLRSLKSEAEDGNDD